MHLAPTHRVWTRPSAQVAAPHSPYGHPVPSCSVHDDPTTLTLDTFVFEPEQPVAVTSSTTNRVCIQFDILLSLHIPHDAFMWVDDCA